MVPEPQADGGIPRHGNLQYYLKRCREACGLRDEELAGLAGYASLKRFRAHEPRWLRCYGGSPVPLAYLRAIGVDFDVLREALEQDIAAYEFDLANPPLTETVMRVPLLGFGQPLSLPRPMSEGELVEYVQSLNTVRCIVNYPGPKSVVIYRDHTVTYYFRPGYRITRKRLIWAGAEQVVARKASSSGVSCLEDEPDTQISNPEAVSPLNAPECYEASIRAVADEDNPRTFLTLRGRRRFAIGPSE